jgi:hypothetical protein
MGRRFGAIKGVDAFGKVRSLSLLSPYKRRKDARMLTTLTDRLWRT